MATWPVSLPVWQLGVAIEVAPVNRSQQEGFRAQRRAFDHRHDVMQARLELTEAQFATFETFVQDTLNQGADSFTGTVYDGSGSRSSTLQFLDGSYDPVWDGDFFNINTRLVVFDRKDPAPDLMAAIYDADTDFTRWGDLLAALEDCVNNNNLE